MDRRKFLFNMAAGAGVAIVTPLVITGCAPNSGSDSPSLPSGTTFDLSQPENAALRHVNGYLKSGNIVIIHTAAGFVALSAICTHESVGLNYSASTGQFTCSRHGARYASTGAVLSGPTSKSLTKYKITQSGDLLTLSY